MDIKEFVKEKIKESEKALKDLENTLKDLEKSFTIDINGFKFILAKIEESEEKW